MSYSADIYNMTYMSIHPSQVGHELGAARTGMIGGVSRREWNSPSCPHTRVNKQTSQPHDVAESEEHLRAPVQHGI